MPYQMTNINSLRDILELECKRGYANKAVIGGLDKYLHKQAGQIRQTIGNRRLLAEFDELNLANSNYASCEVDERRKWIIRVFHWLEKLEELKGEPLASPLPPSQRSKERMTRIHQSPDLTRDVRIAAKPHPQRKDFGIDSSITVIKGITSRVATKFARLNVTTIHDLLYFSPRRYVDYSQRKTIAELKEGEEQTIVATIWQARVATFGNRPGTEAIVGDETGNIKIVWFNQPYLAKGFPSNARIVISGIVNLFKGQKLFESPEWEMLQDKELIHTARLVPIYPLTQGLYPRQVRKWTKEAIDGWAWQVSDFLPSEIKTRCQLLDLPEAVAQIHYPGDHLIAEEAKKRLAFDELLLLQLGVLAKKRNWQQSQPGNTFNIDQEVINTFLQCLPFTLTPAQERVLGEIIADLKQPRAMSRLLQGEVGSGKTVIAALALLIAVANNYQGAFMAPTEVLAEQHFNNICDYLSKASSPTPPSKGRQPAEPPSYQEEAGNVRCYTGFLSHPVSVALLIGSLSPSEKEDLHCKIKQGEIDIVIGTHALIQKGVDFYRLGLAVIDEQQRFGVLQRSSLRQKGFNPHILVMTATPIPRTMALTLYGDLDLSVIDELPPGRQKVKTKYLAPRDTEKAYAFIRRQINGGNQAFIICPLIEESEILDAKAATTEYEYLSREIFPDLRLGLLHGRMSPDDKEKIMRCFRNGTLDILVSTSVVEVGIDIPNATVMLVEGADHFGLSQLHQFRGRVGRGTEQSYCILIPEKSPYESGNRLQLMEKIHDGFALAEKDLELRGPGEFFGTHQSGLPDLKIAKLSNLQLMELARQEAINLFQNDTNLGKPEHYLLRQQLSQVWPKDAEWS
jgi:ATP-dependent DNA helicase RecG